MRIGYDATAAIRQQAGIGRYARELLIALSQTNADDDFRLFVESGGASLPLPNLDPRFRAYPIPVSDRIMNAFWHRARVPAPVELRTGRLDVFHSPDFSLAPSLAPSVVTIHDLAFDIVPQTSSPTLAAYLHRVVPRSIHRARAVIVPSKHTQQAVLNRFGVDEAKVFVVAEGVSSLFTEHSSESDAGVRSARGLEAPFLLTVATFEPRKNLERLLKAFSILRGRGRVHKLVLVGRRGWLDEGIFRTHRDLFLGDSAVFLTDVQDAELASLYRLAELVVCPSIYEGFGLSALEALASGAPLACSGNSSFPEIAGEVAEYFDPWDVEDIVTTLETLLADEDHRRCLAQAGSETASRFSWARAAEATLSVYRYAASS